MRIKRRFSVGQHKVYRIKRLSHVLLYRKIDSIISKCNKCKIGKTGQTLLERFSCNDYKDTYNKIESIYSSKRKSIIDKMEVLLIEKYISDSKCDNQRVEESENDPMTSKNHFYHVYIVYT